MVPEEDDIEEFKRRTAETKEPLGEGKNR